MAGAKKLPSGTWRGWFKNYEGRRVFLTLGRTATRRDVLTTVQDLEVHHAKIRQGVLPRPDQQHTALGRPIAAVIAEYLAWGAFQGARGGRPWTPKHQRTRAQQLTWWQEHLHLRVLGDCLGILPSVERGLQDLRQHGLASKSIKHYLAALAAFCRWCVHRDYLPIDPLARRTPVQVIPRRKRRALTPDERHRLLEHCAPSHRLLYETAMETGLRANELRQLSFEHLDIDRRRLRLDAAWTKNRQAGWQPISPDLFSCLYAAASSGEPLEAYRRARSTLPLPVQPLLFVPRNTAVMLATDCQRVAIPLETAEGRVDFHALRTTAINLFYAHGATPPEAQALARHRTPEQTRDIYGRADDERLEALVEEVHAALVPKSQRAPAVHAQAIGAPLMPQPHEQTMARKQPSMPLRLPFIKTESAHSTPHPRHHSLAVPRAILRDPLPVIAVEASKRHAGAFLCMRIRPRGETGSCGVPAMKQAHEPCDTPYPESCLSATHPSDFLGDYERQQLCGNSVIAYGRHDILYVGERTLQVRG